MADLQSIKRILSEVYGIQSGAELEKALKETGKPNIGVMASATRKETRQHEENDSVA